MNDPTVFWPAFISGLISGIIGAFLISAGTVALLSVLSYFTPEENFDE